MEHKILTAPGFFKYMEELPLFQTTFSFLDFTRRSPLHVQTLHNAREGGIHEQMSRLLCPSSDSDLFLAPCDALLCLFDLSRDLGGTRACLEMRSLFCHNQQVMERSKRRKRIPVAREIFCYHPPYCSMSVSKPLLTFHPLRKQQAISCALPRCLDDLENHIR